ncbi:hypothetical protein CC2G_004728 [Coprinopsis cinerea AmutBmut pab1-1]|nr:hypothetical protein CC2G_004728 [Coprinopsis cinerea AmutBmut pab1-1]
MAEIQFSASRRQLHIVLANYHHGDDGVSWISPFFNALSFFASDEGSPYDAVASSPDSRNLPVQTTTCDFIISIGGKTGLRNV